MFDQKFEDTFLYTNFFQSHFAPDGYFKYNSKQHDDYLKMSSFLPRINNEINHFKSEEYKQKFSSLNRLGLVMFMLDEMVIPKESEWF